MSIFVKERWRSWLAAALLLASLAASPGRHQAQAASSPAHYAGWAVVEWECCIKHPDQGAAEGAELVRRHIIQVQERAFDANMQAQGVDRARNRAALGL